MSDRSPSSWTAKKLKDFLREKNINFVGVTEKSELVELVQTCLVSAAPDDVSLPSQQRSAQEWSRCKLHKSVEKGDVSDIRYLRAHAGDITDDGPLLRSVLRILVLNRQLDVTQTPPAFSFISALCFGDDEGESMQTAIRANSASSKVCGRSLRQSDIVYKCLQCGADPTCIMCAACFHASPCVNHDYRMMRSGGGMCDCGDPTAWKPESFCKHHAGTGLNDDPTECMEPASRRWITTVLGGAALFSIVVLNRFDDGGIPAESPLETSLEKTLSLFSNLCNLGDTGKRLVLDALREVHSLHQTSATNFPLARNKMTLETTLLDEIVKRDNKLRRSFSSHFYPLIKSIISDASAKLDVLRSFLRSQEAASAVEGRGASDRKRQLLFESVQVLTVPWAVNAAMDPEQLQLGNQTNALHRLMSSLIHGLSLKHGESDYPHFDPAFGENGACPIIKLTRNNDNIDKDCILHSCYDLKYAISTSPLAGQIFSTSRVLMNSLFLVLQAVQVSDLIRRDDAADNRNGRHDFLAWDASLTLSATVQHQVGEAMLTFMKTVEKGDAVDIPVNLVALQEGTISFPLPPKGGLDPLPLFFKGLLERCAVESTGMFPLTRRAYAASVLKAGRKFLDESIAALLPFTQDRERLVLEMEQMGDSRVTLGHVCLIHKGHAVTLVLPLIRLLGNVIRAFLITAPKTVSRSSLIEDVRSLLPITVLGEATSCFHWADLLIMPHVLASQVRNQLWKRDYFSVSRQLAIYQTLQTSRMMEMDIFTLQVLTTVAGAHNLASQALVRFTYTPQKDRFSKGAVAPGYSDYLTLLLCLVGDTLHSSCCKSHATKSRIVMCMAPQPPMLHSELISALGKDADDDDEDTEKETAVERLLQESTTSERQKTGTMRRLKGDENIWRTVSAYNSHWSSNERKSAMTEFSMKFKDLDVIYPKATLGSHHPALDDNLRALLHSRPGLSVAVFSILHKCCEVVSKVNIEQTNGHPSFASIHELIAAAKNANVLLVSDSLLFAAIDFLLLSVESTQFIANEEASRRDPQLSGEGNRVGTVKDFEAWHRRISFEPYFDEHEFNPLPENVNCSNVFGLFEQKFSVYRHLDSRKPGYLGERSDFPAPVCLIEALHVIRALFDDELSKFGVSASCTSIECAQYSKRLALLISVLAPDQSHVSSISTVVDASADDERAKRIRQKQEVLLARMKKRQQKATTAHNIEDSRRAVNLIDDSSTTNVHDEVMMKYVDAECCFCRQGDESGSLMFLSHASTSANVERLRHCRTAALGTGFDPQRLSATVLMCGHAAHMECIIKHHEYLNKQRGQGVRGLFMSRQGFRGMTFLGGAEFLCPLCSRIATVLSCIPKLQNAESGSRAQFALTEWILSNRETNAQPFNDFLIEVASGFSRSTDHAPLKEEIWDSWKKELGESAFSLYMLAMSVADNISLLHEGYLKIIGSDLTTHHFASLGSQLTTIVTNIRTAVSQQDFFNIIQFCGSNATSPPQLDSAELFALTAVHELCGVENGDKLDEVISDLCSEQFLGRLIYSTLVLVWDDHPDTKIVSIWNSLVKLSILKTCLCGSLPVGNQNAFKPPMEDLPTVDALKHFEASISVLLQHLVPETYHTCNVTEVTVLLCQLLDKWSRPPPAPGRLVSILNIVKANMFVNRICAHEKSVSATAIARCSDFLFLPNNYMAFVQELTEQAVCSVCDATPKIPMMCLWCKALLCLRARDPEILNHSRSCGFGVGAFIIIRGTGLVIVEGTTERATQLRSVYVDRFGETDEMHSRGAALFRSAKYFQSDFLMPLILNGWDHDTAALESAFRHSVSEL